MYVEKRVVENMTKVMNDIFECITVEIQKEKKKNTIASCIYRTPGYSGNGLRKHTQLQPRRFYLSVVILILIYSTQIITDQQQSL